MHEPHPPNRPAAGIEAEGLKMSQSSPVSSTRHAITIESRERRGSDPLVASRGKEIQRLPSGDSDVGKPCQKCGIKCQGFMPHLWRKKCITCGCDREQHRKEIVSFELIQSMEGISLQQSMKAQEQSLKKKYTWYPKGIPADMVEQYMQCIPEECVPLRGSKGEEWRENQYMRQLPAYDTCPDICHDMDDTEKKRMLKFVERRRRKCFGVGEIETLLESKSCTRCEEVISQGSIVLMAARAGNESVWHPRCFRCYTCSELLVDLLYFSNPEDQQIYCGRHHGEKMVPRCAGCDEIIFSSTYTEAGGKKWHKQHLCCSRCDSNVSGKRFIEEFGDVLCDMCFDKIAVKCQKCKEPIGIGSMKKTHKGISWHEKCFVCKRCNEDLSSSRFFVLKGDLYCDDCMEPIAQCHSCKQGIKASVSYLKHKNRTWHADCFKCVICQAWLVDGEFNELDNNLICHKCFVNKVSKKCIVCNESITGRAVQFGLSTYHPECFTCSECSSNLTAETGPGKVKEKMGKPVCLDCHLKSAMKCFKCRDPIVSKHTIYKGRPFHLECFTCNKCGASVAKTEFFETSLNEILCMRCGN